MAIPSLVRKVIPRRVKDYFWDVAGYSILSIARKVIYRRGPEDHDRDLCLGCLDHQIQHTRLLRRFSESVMTIEHSLVKNTLPNSGAVPVDAKFRSAREIVLNYQDPNRRRQQIPGFEGFAPDDAVCDWTTDLWEVWSNARLAGFIADFAHANYENPSLLELGCGAGSLFFFLRRYGICNYVGIDGSPYFLEYSPFLAGYERHFMTLNLQEEIRLREYSRPLQFDVVCSFEVLEHIREDAIDNLIHTMRNHMHARSILLCTASRQSQIDIHVLVRERGWWLDRFSRAGLVPHKNAQKVLVRLGTNHPFNWAPENTNMFALSVHE